MKPRGFFIALCVCGISATSNATGNDLPEGADEALAFLAARIPAGTLLAAAQRQMEALGFSCAPGYGQSYPGATSVGTFLYCDRKVPGVITKRWQAALVHGDGRVSSVHVTYGTIGP